MQKLEYHGIRPCDSDGTDGLRNPERGFRLEIAGGEIQPGAKYYPENKITCLPPAVEKNLTGKESNDDLWVKSFEYYSDEGLTLALCYIYLTDYYNKDIPQEKIDAIQETFNHFRDNGRKVIPLFLYENNMQCTFGPTVEQTLKGIEQLAPLIRKNSDIISVMRVGFVGAFGEWHCSFNKINEDHEALSRIVSKLLEVVPEDRMLCIRVPKYKRWVLNEEDLSEYELLNGKEAYSGSPKSRISHADDGFMASDKGIMNDGYAWTEPPYYASTGNPEFDMMSLESAYLMIDGEMFIQDMGGVIDGYAAAKRLRLQHYSSLSYFHGNNEMEFYGNNNPPQYNINRWKTTEITKAQLIADKMPVSDGYFEDASGSYAGRTQYEYIRDHLGYRLELQKAVFPKKIEPNGKFEFNASLINRGFAALNNPRAVYLVLIDQNGKVAQPYKIVSADPRRWQPFNPNDKSFKTLKHKIAHTMVLGEDVKKGKYQIGLWMPDAYESIRSNPDYAVRFANRDVKWWVDANNQYGVNIIGEVEVK